MKYLFLISLLSLALVACNENRIYDEHQDLSPDIEWQRNKVVEFNVDIKDTNVMYNMSIALRFISGYPYKTMELNTTTTTPSGKKSNTHYTLEVIADDNSYNGEGAGDYWDLEQMVEANVKFHEIGTYKFTMQHDMPRDPATHVMELGLIVDKKK